MKNTCFKYLPGQFSLPLKKTDPRLKVALETPEPLIHFALVCGAKSCPPIKTYSVDVSLILCCALRVLMG